MLLLYLGEESAESWTDNTGTFYIADEDGNPIPPEELEAAINALRGVSE